MSDMWPDIYLGKKKDPIPTGHHQQSFNINFHFSYFFHSRLLNLVLSVANIKDPFSYSSEHLLEKKKAIHIQPHESPLIPSFKLPSLSLWLPRGPRWNDLFCFASLVPSVVRAGLSVPEHGNVMVARGDWRRCRPGGLWLNLCHHHCLVPDPHDTIPFASQFLLIYSYIWADNKNASFVYMQY